MSGTTSPAPPAPLGAKTAPVLMAIFQDAYRQELGAEEDVHRTLPFFATALSFVIAAINYTVGQLAGLELREQLLSDYAGVIPVNRQLTLRRYTYRARAVSCLLLSLLFALLATMLALATTTIGFVVKA